MRTEIEQPAPAPAKRQGLPPYFDRRDAKPPAVRFQPPEPTFGVAEPATLPRVEQRLGEVERKLDKILKVLESKTP